MPNSLRAPLGAQVRRALAWTRREESLVLLPAITLAGFWGGGERLLLLLALGLPLVFVIAGSAGRAAPAAEGEEASPVARAIATIDRRLAQAAGSGQATACLVARFDQTEAILDRHGRAAQDEVLARATDRLSGALRAGDAVIALPDRAVAVVLAPVRRLDIEMLVQMAARLQEAVAEPVALGGAQVCLSCSVGFCIDARSPARAGRSLLDAAQAAADEASRHGPGAIRAFTEDMAQRRAERDALRDAVEAALDRGEIRPHFQPQVSTDTGEVSGVEALARWHHTERGCLLPADFLPAVEAGDLGERLGEAILYHALAALKHWDGQGLHVPSVAVNFSAGELRNPRLPDRIRWELDRFELAPGRLTVEILESVLARTDNDVIVSVVGRLAGMGCGIDLDDFGTGHTSITTIRRFSVRRLKIDRSFVTAVDSSREQQRLVAAIVSMAGPLGLETLAEGVETAAEHAMLAQLGCSHVQGYGPGRPMPVEAATEWLRARRDRSATLPRIGARR